MNISERVIVGRNVKLCKNSWVFTGACAGQAGSQEPQWWMKRGFCLIIGIINCGIPPRPRQRGTNYRLSGDAGRVAEAGIKLYLWRANNSWQTITLPSLSIGHTCHVSGHWPMINSSSTDSSAEIFLFINFFVKIPGNVASSSRYDLSTSEAVVMIDYWCQPHIFTVLMTLAGNYTTPQRIVIIILVTWKIHGAIRIFRIVQRNVKTWASVGLTINRVPPFWVMFLAESLTSLRVPVWL